jgi:hypothetical protein
VVDVQNQNNTAVPLLSSESLNRPVKVTQTVSNGTSNNLSVGSIGEIKKGRFSVVESGKSVGQMETPVTRDSLTSSPVQMAEDLVPPMLEKKNLDKSNEAIKGPRRFTVSNDLRVNALAILGDKKSRFDLGETPTSGKFFIYFSKCSI